MNVWEEKERVQMNVYVTCLLFGKLVVSMKCNPHNPNSTHHFLAANTPSLSPSLSLSSSIIVL